LVDAGVLGHDELPMRLSEPFVTAYMDDVAITLGAPAEDIVQVAAEALAILDDMARRHLLKVNYGPGKTELVFFWAGAGVKEAKRQLYCSVPQNECPVVRFDSPDGITAVRVVERYKHLGALLATDLSLAPHFARVAAFSRDALWQMRKHLIKNPIIELQDKTILISSLVLSRSYASASALPEPRGAEIRGLYQTTISTARALLNKEKMAKIKGATDAVVLRESGLLHPRWQLALLRAMLAIQLVERGAWPLLGLACAAASRPRSWWASLQADLQRAADATQLWETKPPSDVVGLLRCAKAGASSCRALLKRAFAWANDMSLCDAALAGVLPEPEQDAAALLHCCRDCTASVCSHVALAVHAATCHGYRQEARRYAIDQSCCIAC
jgi:hypothetical protein